MLEEFDAAIIGSGHNSLVCAAHLQQKGWRTIVLEQAAEPGGAVKTLELTEPGFRHDWAAMNLSLFAGSAFNREYAEKLGACGLEFVPADKCFASVFPEGKWLGVGTDLAATRERIAAFSKADAETWGELVEEFPGKAEYIFALLGSPMKTHIQGRLLAKALWKKGGAWTTALARLLIASPRTWLSETFESDHVRATLGGLGDAPRLRPRYRRRRHLSLPGIDGQSELRHGDRQGRRRHADPGTCSHSSRRAAERFGADRR